MQDTRTIIRTPITDIRTWLTDRQKYIGASEVPIVCGVDGRFASRAVLFAIKKGLRPLESDNAAMRRGRLGESACLEALCEERPDWQVQRAKVHVVDLDRRLSCTPDAAALRPDRDGIGIIQAKTIARSVFAQKWHDGDDGEIVPPPAYHLQTLTEMMLNECAWGVLAVLVVGEFIWDFHIIELERNAALEDRILHDVAAFWHDFLDPGIMPPLEPARDEELVKALYPRDNGTTIDLAGDNRALALVEDLTQTQAALKRLRNSETEIKTELSGKLGEHTFGRLADGRRISWKLQHRKAYSVEAADFRVLRVLKSSQ